jgi:hypothetical protein
MGLLRAYKDGNYQIKQRSTPGGIRIRIQAGGND